MTILEAAGHAAVFVIPAIIFVTTVIAGAAAGSAISEFFNDALYATLPLLGGITGAGIGITAIIWIASNIT